ncbi:MAG TPA: hypothetical protein VKQ08_07250, partial [Cyclobacteriaceae bacterium]|nr:hypothetical protein [Cyclobacteriaceae bacterium]
IYLHAENNREPKSVEVPDHATVEEIILICQQYFPNGTTEEIFLFVEDDETPRERHVHHGEAGIQHHHHIHCHRCKMVDVIVIYNGDDKSFPVAPSTTVKKLLQKVIHAFHISDQDAGDYVLKLDDKTILKPSDHIGSFTTFPRCHVKLFLTPIKPING